MKKILEFQQDIKAYYEALYRREYGAVSVKFRLFELKAHDTANIDIVVGNANGLIAHLRGPASYIDGKLSMEKALNLADLSGAQS
jgi:hypothetical protein